MKGLGFLGTILLVAILSSTAFGSEALELKASYASVDSAITYYSRMARLQKSSSTPLGVSSHDYHATLDYLKKNKSHLANAVMDANAYGNMSDSIRLIDDFCRKSRSKHRASVTTASCPAYFDAATGHRYMRNPDNTYTQYSRKGKILRRDVPAGQYNLTFGKWIRPIGKGCYLMYEKTGGGNTQTIALPATEAPLKGWRCKKVLYSLK